MKKLIFGALASVLFASTGFAKGGETLVNENLTLNSENVLTIDSKEELLGCTSKTVTVTTTNPNGSSTSTSTTTVSCDTAK